MHPCLNVEEILRLLTCGLVALEAKATGAPFACCCKGFEDPVLDVLWESQDRLVPLLKCFPQEVWEGEDRSFALRRVPTKAEWAVFRRYARRMRKLMVDTSEDPVTSDILFTLQLHAANGPLLPKLKTFECGCITRAFVASLEWQNTRHLTGLDVSDPPLSSAQRVEGASKNP